MVRTTRCLLAWALLCGLIQGAVIYVPDDQPTIQDAIDAAADGDRIVVRPGIYCETVDLKGKGVILQSEQGPYGTTIDGGQSGTSVVRIPAGNGSILDGFTIRNGCAIDGGGIYCNNDGVKITNNIITENKASAKGAGIHCDNCSPVIAHNLILSNKGMGPDAIGGGIVGEFAPKITGNLVIGNSATHVGGICVVGNAVLSNNVIAGNIATCFAGGVDVVVADNARIINCIIAGNRGGWGGGVRCDGAGARIVNCTLFGNLSSSGGGGVACCSAEVKIANTIIWNNEADDGYEISLSRGSHGGSAATIEYSNLEGGQAAVSKDYGCPLNWGQGMIDADPLFVESAEYDFHLTYQSPCKDTGFPNAALPSEDFEADPRVSDGVPDMGADEFHPRLYCRGAVAPASWLSVRIVGEPGAAIVLGEGSGVKNSPVQTPYGLRYLKIPVTRYQIGPIPASGVRVFPARVPSFWSSGEEHFFQAMVWGPAPALTNLMVLQVE